MGDGAGLYRICGGFFFMISGVIFSLLLYQQGAAQMTRGFYLLHRGWMENEAFENEPFTDREAWLWLIENAWFKAGLMTKRRVTYTVPRGAIPTSYRTLKKTWSWGQGRVSRYVESLKKHGMVGTPVGTPFLLIQLENYDKYQTPVGTPVGTVPGTLVGTPLYREKEGKRKKRSAGAREREDAALPLEAVPLAEAMERFARIKKALEPKGCA